MVWNDKPCGSTIGPFLSKKLGIVSVDIGAPLMAMHSVREFGGTKDLLDYKNLMGTFFESIIPSIKD